MKTFVDNAGRTWTVAMNVAVLKRVKSLTGVDLNTLLDGGELLNRLTTDAILLGEVLWAVVAPEAAAKIIGEDDFLGALAGDCLEHALEAFLTEVVGFTRNPRDRARLTRVLKKVDQYNAIARDVLERRVDLGDEKFREVFTDLVNEAYLIAKRKARVAMGLDEEEAPPSPPAESPGGSSTRPPESAESTPDPSPSPS